MSGSDLTFLHGSHTPCCVYVHDRPYPDYCTLQLMVRGKLSLSYDEESQELAGSWLWCGYPGPHVRFAGIEGAWDHRYVAFRGSLVSQWTAEGLFPFSPQEVVCDANDWAGRFDELIEASRRGDRLGMRLASNLLEKYLLDLASLRAMPSPENQWLKQVMEVLGEAFHLKIDYAHLAHQWGMSLSGFRVRFRREAGISLHAYVVQCRITKARALLSQTELPIDEIAQTLGYRDIYFFGSSAESVDSRRCFSPTPRSPLLGECPPEGLLSRWRCKSDLA